MLLSLRPGHLHLLQSLSHGLLVHVRRGVQAVHEVAPGRKALFQHVGHRRLGVPALTHVGKLLERRPTPVLPELHIGEVRQVPLAGLLHVSLTQKMGAGNLALARAFLRHRTTSIPWQTWSGLWLLSLKTSGGRRGDSTYCSKARRLKRDSSVVACEDSKAVLFRWHSKHRAWRFWAWAEKDWCTGTMWSSSRVAAVMGAAQSLH